MLIGYARVSTNEQDTALQLDALKAAGAGLVFEEKRSGADALRPQLRRMLDQLRPGDVVTVYKLDRLARSLADLLSILARIEAAGARFRSLTEAIDTTTPAGRMMMQLLGAFAEFERNMIRERTAAGLRAAIDRGTRCGRPPALSHSEGRRAAQLVAEGKATLSGLARLHGVHLSSIKRAIQRAQRT